jgi:hypothetical protein
MSSTYKAPIVSNRPPQVSDLGFYTDIRFDADDAAPIYIGLNVQNGADVTTDNDWKILKFTYVNNAVTRIQTAYGNWTARASYF